MSDLGGSKRQREVEILHQLRSVLARSQAEAEILGLDGVAVSQLVDALAQAFRLLTGLEDLLSGSTVRTTGVLAIVIDDDARLGELTAARLVKRGVSASHSQDLDAALRASEAAIPIIDLGILLSASEAVRSLMRDRRFVVVSGENSPSSRAEAMALGAADYFLKPVRIDELTTRLEAIREGQM